MRLTPYQTCPGLDLAWAGPLCLSALARRYVVEPESVKQAAEAMGLPELRPCHALLGRGDYRAHMDRALIADLDFQCRLRVLTDEESEMLVAATVREKHRGHSSKSKRRLYTIPERRAADIASSVEWQRENRERHLANRRAWRKANAARLRAKARQLHAARAAEVNAQRRQRYAERKGQQA